MSNIIAWSNHKGGVSKTTTCVNVGAALASLKKKVLLIDLDPQANLTQSLGVNGEIFNLYGCLKKRYPMDPLNVVPYLDIIPGTVDLAGMEVELNNEPGREYILKELLDPLKMNYEFILIDCAPSLGLITLNAFTAADMVIIPLQSEYLAMSGLTRILEIITKVQARINPQLKFEGVVITQFDKRKILNKDIASSVGTHLGDKVFKTFIRENISLAEAPSAGLDIFRYSPNSNGAADYLKLTKELLDRIH